MLSHNLCQVDWSLHHEHSPILVAFYEEKKKKGAYSVYHIFHAFFLLLLMKMLSNLCSAFWHH